MGQDSEVYVGLDTSKLKISVAIADAGRDGEVRFFGDIDSSPEAVGRLVAKLGKRAPPQFVWVWLKLCGHYANGTEASVRGGVRPRHGHTLPVLTS